MKTEKHPLVPFLPENARILMLGSFPPPRARWSMEFYYPNWGNDMWRIIGHVFFGDRHYFEAKGCKCFDKEAVEGFCRAKGIALYDTASEVLRLKENASDKFLEVVTPTDIPALLQQIPECCAIVTTGQKATGLAVAALCCQEPPLGGFTTAEALGRRVHLWRMPSSSRAYPLALEEKASHYSRMFMEERLME